MNKELLVSNWKQVYKSLAVILPTVATVIYSGLVETGQINELNPLYVAVIVAVAGSLGWVIPQKGIKK